MAREVKCPRRSSLELTPMYHQRDMLISMATPDSILIVDDHALVRDGMRTLLQGCFAQCNILEAANYAEAREALAGHADVDLVLLDLNIPDAKRFSALQGLREEHPAVPVVMVSGTLDGSAVREALSAGAAGFIPKSLKRDQIVEALRQVLAGEIYVPDFDFAEEASTGEETSIRQRIATLTPQQKVVLGLLVSGRLNKQIAYELDVSMTTVKAHVSAILQKLNVFSRTQAVILANRVNFPG